MKGRIALVKRTVNYLGEHALAAVALACSLLALAGSSYAAFTISGSQIRNRSIDPVKLNPKFIAGNVRAWARVGADGHLVAGQGVRTVGQQVPGLYIITWKTPVTGRCATVASVEANNLYTTEVVNGTHFVAGYASAATSGPVRAGNPPHIHPPGSVVQTFNQQGQPIAVPFSVAVAC